MNTPKNTPQKSVQFENNYDYRETDENINEGIMKMLFPDMLFSDEESEEGFDLDDHFGLND